MIIRNDPEHDGREVNYVGSLHEFYKWFVLLALLNMNFC